MHLGHQGRARKGWIPRDFSVAADTLRGFKSAMRRDKLYRAIREIPPVRVSEAEHAELRKLILYALRLLRSNYGVRADGGGFVCANS